MSKRDKYDYIVISDLHLTDRFDPRKWSRLEQILSKSDNVIINGDFWDSWFCTYDQFTHSGWGETLLELLSKKNTIYIFGNHDRKYQCSREIEFAKFAGEHYTLDYHNKKLHFVHGDELLDKYRSRVFMQYARLIRKLESTNLGRWILRSFDYIGRFAIYLGLDNLFGANSNSKLKQDATALEENHILFCGDTHFAEVDLKSRFVNSGPNNNGKYNFVGIRDGEIKLYSGFY